MPDVSLGRFSRWIEKFTNAKGGPVLVDVAPTIQTIAQLDKGIDHRYLEGWNRFGASAQQAAVAAQFSRARIRNPVGSNVYVILEMLTVAGVAADNPIVTWGATVTDLATLVPLAFTRIDPRGNPQPTAIISVNAQAAGGAILMQRTITATTNVDFITYADGQLSVLPGQVLDVQSAVVNTALNVTFVWRERALESSELT